ncbi:DUF5671 domain-containing protein [Chloroflexota bacterium]
MIPLIPIFMIASMIYLIIRFRDDWRQLLVLYFYFMTAASVIMIVIGLIFLLQVIFSRFYGGGEIENNLTLAGVLSGTGLFIIVLHVYGRLTIENKNDKATTSLRRVYLFSMLGIFSICGLTSLILTTNQILRYYIVETGNAHSDETSVALAVVTVLMPVWIYFSFRVFREVTGESTGKKAEHRMLEIDPGRGAGAAS